MSASFERLLVRLPNWLGDALMARPALQALRAAHPRARVTACGPEALLDLLAGDGAWDDAVPWPLAPGGAARLRAARPEAALVLPPSFSSAWSAWRTGAPVRVGFAHEGRSPWLTRAVRRPARGERHLADEYLGLAAELGAAKVARTPPPLSPGDAARDAARGHLAAAGVNGPYAIVAPGAAYGPAKRWPAARFAEVARALADRGFAVLACGASGEVEACAEVARGSGARTLAGATSLAAQAGLCEGAGVVVSNDSGLAHLAAALGAPTVAVFGSTSSAWTAPMGRLVRIVQRPPVCSPCFARTCRVDYACLTAVSVADVLRAADDARGAAPPAPRRREEVPS